MFFDPAGSQAFGLDADLDRLVVIHQVQRDPAQYCNAIFVRGSAGKCRIMKPE